MDISQEEAYPKMLGVFFKAVTQVMVFFGVETWVLTPRVEQALGSFQHRVARWLTGRHPRRWGTGVGNTHHWRRQRWKQSSRGSVNTSRGGRTRSGSILRHDRFWTSVSGLFGGQGQGCLGGGGNRLVYTSRGRRKWRQRQQRIQTERSQ